MPIVFGTPYSVTLIDGSSDGAALFLPPITIGYGTVEVTASIRVSDDATTYPGRGWAIVAQEEGSTIPTAPRNTYNGVDTSRNGVWAQWDFMTTYTSDDTDIVRLYTRGSSIASEGTYNPPSFYAFDEADTSETQPMTLRIRADIPGTATNEALVQVDVGSVLAAECTGSGCAYQFEPGDSVRFGITASSFSYGSVIRTDAGNFEVTAPSLCY